MGVFAWCGECVPVGINYSCSWDNNLSNTYINYMITELDNFNALSAFLWVISVKVNISKESSILNIEYVTRNYDKMTFDNAKHVLPKYTNRTFC